jgi:hypothetical protein
MDVYGSLVSGYHNLLSVFPGPVQWFITLAVLIALVYGFVVLISANVLFLILLAVLLPAIIPILMDFLMDIYRFFLYLLVQIGLLKSEG